MNRRLNKRERERNRRHRHAELERDAGMLPADGPIGEAVTRIAAELDRCITCGRSSEDREAGLHALGLEAFGLVGSLRGLRAVAWKASHRGAGQPDVRTALIDAAWNEIGDDRGVWISRGVR